MHCAENISRINRDILVCKKEQLTKVSSATIQKKELPRQVVRSSQRFARLLPPPEGNGFPPMTNEGILIMRRNRVLGKNIPLSPVPAKNQTLSCKKRSWLHILLSPFRWTLDSWSIMIAGTMRCLLGALILFARVFIGGFTVILKPFLIMNAMDLPIGKITALYFLFTGICFDVLKVKIPDPLPMIAIRTQTLMPNLSFLFSRLRFGNDPIGIMVFKLLAAIIFMGIMINLTGVLSNGLLCLIGITLSILTIFGILRDPKAYLGGLFEREQRLVLSYIFGALCFGEGIAMLIPYVNLIFRKHDPVEDMQIKYDLFVGDCFRP